MAKKVKASAKKSNRRSQRKSTWFDKVFSFPALVIAAFAILSITTFYLVAKPSYSGVEGANTNLLYEDVSDANYNKSLVSPQSTNDYPRYLYLRIFSDANGDGKKKASETCPLKDYTVVINGTSKTKTQKLKCGWNRISVYECNTVKFGSNLKNYSYSGMTYTDKDGSEHFTRERSISFCGGKYFEGGWSRSVSFGLKPK